MGLLDSNAEELMPIDSSGGRVTIDCVHHEVHDGSHFTNFHAMTMDSVTAHTVTITAPASAVGFIHLVLEVESTAAGTWTFSESPESSAGSALTAYNNKRNDTATSGTTIKGNVVWTSAGTVLEQHYIGANNPGSKLGGGANVRNEYILKPSTTYGIRFANTAATTYSVIETYFYLD